MNKVILMGRLTRDAEIRYSQGENSTAVARFTMAVDRRFRRDGSNDQSADFISCVAFGKTAEFMERYTHQGTKLVVEGRIQTGSYTNKDGNKVYTTDVVVENTEFAESKSTDSSSGFSGNNGGGFERSSRPEPTSAVGDGFMNIPDGVEDEGLPFN
jgi:single-strand DNA-binding protein